MARKRMFASDLIQSDRFILISYEAQLLYFHLCLRADDEGFLRSPQAILKTLDMDSIANSVVVFDEAQSLPIQLTEVTLRAVKELCRSYNTTMVFSTATQPNFAAIQDLNWSPREIVPDYPEMFNQLRRVTVQWRIQEPTALEDIGKEMSGHKSVCTIVNLRRHASELYHALKELCPEEECFFLTTDLCPAHRTRVVQEVQKRLREHKPCRMVATQCIEAGVDLDFDNLYRALAPLESIVQAAGRCNRNGRRKDKGHAFHLEAVKRF